MTVDKARELLGTKGKKLSDQEIKKLIIGLSKFIDISIERLLEMDPEKIKNS